MPVIKSKKAQVLGMPFQMIFSIILIAVFIYVAIVGIKMFMNNANSLKTLDFVTSFRADLEETMNSYENPSSVQKYSLPDSIKYLCFTSNAAEMKNSSLPNLNATRYPKFASLKGNYVFFYPFPGFLKIPYAKVDCEVSCLNVTRALNPTNVYCIPNKDGEARIVIAKEPGMPYLTIQ